MEVIDNMKLVILHGGFVGGVARYRAFNPAWALEELGHTISYITVTEPSTKESLEEDIEKWYIELKDADFIHITSPQDIKMFNVIVKLKKMINEKRIFPNHLRIISDYDDYLFDISPTNPSYCDLGIKEVKLSDGTYLWKDKEYYQGGLKQFDIKKNIKKHKDIKNIIAMSDIVTTTTDYLANKLRPINFRVQVIPNHIEDKLFNVGERIEEEDNTVRILYAGGNSHYRDFLMVKPILSELMKKYDNVKLVFMGEKYGCGRDIPLSRIEHIPFASDYNEYIVNLLTTPISFGICPLEDNEFNRCKSNIKMLEYGGCGIPSVMSEIVYGIDGKNIGLVADNVDKFKEHIETMIINKELRETLGKKSKEYINSEYNLNRLGKLYESILEATKNNKVILTGMNNTYKF